MTGRAGPVRIATVDLSNDDIALLEALDATVEAVTSAALAERVGQQPSVAATRLGVFKRLGLVEHDRRTWRLTAAARANRPWQP